MGLYGTGEAVPFQTNAESDFFHGLFTVLETTIAESPFRFFGTIWSDTAIAAANSGASRTSQLILTMDSAMLMPMLRSPGHGWPAYLAVFLLALGLRLGYEAFVWNGPLGNADSAAYEDLAVKIARLQPYQTEHSAGPGGFPSDMQRTPGYPAFLAVIDFPYGAETGMSKHRISVVQCILGAAFASWLAWLTTTLTNRWIGLLAGCFYATDWVSIVHTPMVLSETAYAVVLGTAVLTYALALSRHRNSLYLIAGLLLGCAALVKPAAQVVILAFLIGWLFQRPKRLSGLLFLVTYLACVLPWMVRNETKYGVFTLSEIGTVTLYFYNAQGSLHYYPLSDLKGNQLNDDVNVLDRSWRTQSLSPHERSRIMRQRAITLIAHNWRAVFWQSAIGGARTSLGTASVTAADSMNAPPGRVSRVLLNVLPLIQICLIWAIAIYACFAAGFLRLEIRVLLVASVLCILLPGAAPLAHSRFRVPAVPALCVLAAAGVAELGTRHGRRKHRQEVP